MPVQRGFPLENIGDKLLARSDAGEDFLPGAGKHIAAMNLNTVEFFVPGRDKNPITIVQMKYSGCRYNRVGLSGFALKGSGGKHPDLEDSGVANFDADLCRADAGVKTQLNVRDPSCELPVWIGVDSDFCALA